MPSEVGVSGLWLRGHESDLYKRTEHTQVGCGKDEIAKAKMRSASKKRPWLNIKGIAAILTPVVLKVKKTRE